MNEPFSNMKPGISPETIQGALDKGMDDFTKSIINGCSDIIFCIDERNHIVYNNQKFEDYFFAINHQKPSGNLVEYIGSKAYKIVQPKIELIRSGTESNSFSSIKITNTGEHRTLSLRLSLYLAKNTEKYILIHATDMIEYSTLAQSLETSQEKLNYSANSIKDQFLMNIGHEVRTPLNAILGFSKRLTKKATDNGLPNYITSYSQHILNAGKRLSTLFNRIFEVASIKPIDEETEMSFFSICALCENLIVNLTLIHELPTDTIKLHIPENHDGQLYSNEHSLSQALNAILTNAIKFSGDHKEIDIRLQESNQQFIISISDNGIGIAEEDKDIIFELFHQIDGSYSRQHEGAGIGLTLVWRIIQVLGGTLSVTSELHKGSCFEIMLPTLKQKAQNISPPLKLSTTPEILIVEDNPSNQFLITEILSELQVEFFIASSGQEAIELAQKRRPSLVIMDIHMPGMDGFETTRCLKKLDGFEQVPILALTADIEAKTKEKAEQVGMAGFLSKPIDPDKLSEILERWFQGIQE